MKEPWIFASIGNDEEIAGGILVSEVSIAGIALSRTLSCHSKFVNRTMAVTTKSKNSHSILNSRLPADRVGLCKLVDEPDGDFAAAELVLLFHVIPRTFQKEHIGLHRGRDPAPCFSFFQP